MESGALACWSFRKAEMLWTQQPGGSPRTKGKQTLGVAPKESQAADPVLALDVAAGGRQAISAGAGKTLLSWQLHPNSCAFRIRKRLELPNEGVSELSIRADLRLFAVAGWDRRVRIYSSKTHKLVALLRLHGGSVYSVDFAPPDSQDASVGLIATGSKDSRIALWQLFPKPMQV